MISYAGQIVRFFTYLNMFFDQNIIGRDWRRRVISDCRHDVSTIRRQCVNNVENAFPRSSK